MKVADTVCLCLRYVEDFILLLFSSGRGKDGETYKVRFWNDSSHLTLPERCNGIEDDADYRGEKLVGTFKECGLGILNDVGNSYPGEIGNPRRWIQRLVGHDSLIFRPAIIPKRWL